MNNERKVAEFLGNAYINFVENTADRKPLRVLYNDNITFSTAINTILGEYKYHPNVLNIRKNFEQVKCFSLSEVTATGVWKLIKRINTNQGHGRRSNTTEAG